MPPPVIDLAGAIAAVDRSVGLKASATAFINNVAALMVAAVTKALEEDDAADQGSVDVAVAAINAKAAELNGASDALAAALANHNPPPPPPPDNPPPLDPSAKRR